VLVLVLLLLLLLLLLVVVVVLLLLLPPLHTHAATLASRLRAAASTEIALSLRGFAINQWLHSTSFVHGSSATALRARAPPPPRPQRNTTLVRSMRCVSHTCRRSRSTSMPDLLSRAGRATHEELLLERGTAACTRRRSTDALH
jgi:hypothetical protein